MTSAVPSQYRLTQIDDLNRGEHFYLQDEDECYFLGEYTARGGYGHSPTNQLIFNLKKGPKHRDTPVWHYKEKAIEECAGYFVENLNPGFLAEATLVPVPPSRVKSDPQYDDRILWLLKSIAKRVEVSCDIRELVVQRQSYQPSHLTEDRMKPSELREIYTLALHHVQSAPRQVAVFDDVITSGCHFRAIKDLLEERWPGIPVIGLFVARVVRDDRPEPAPPDFRF